jgi:hypothetical protein
LGQAAGPVVAERRNSMGAVPDPDLAFAIAADEVVLAPAARREGGELADT